MSEMAITEKNACQPPFVMRVLRDDTIPAFGAWCAGSMKDAKPTVLLNLEACLSPCVAEDGEEIQMSLEERKWLMITTLLHEFGHALQEFFDMEFEEERLERIVQEYEYQHGPVAQPEEAADLNPQDSGPIPDGANSQNIEGQ